MHRSTVRLALAATASLAVLATVAIGATPATAATAKPAVTAQTVTARPAAGAAGFANDVSITCNLNIQPSYTSPNPRLVSWTATEGCNSVIGGIAIIQSTLYYSNNGSPIAIAEGTHPSQSPAYNIYSTGSASPGNGGQFFIRVTYQLQLAVGQGVWNSRAGCSAGGSTFIQCTNDSAAFTLLGNPLIAAVVNGDPNQVDIHTTSVLTIWGQWFHPNDVVYVNQNGITQTVGAGSPWWYDGLQNLSTGQSQLNFQLPPGIQPGAATIQVVTSDGMGSNYWGINILP